MDQRIAENNQVCRLTIKGKMTFDVAVDLEEEILLAMRGHRNLEVDLAGVSEIDLCGIHLLGLLKNDENRDIVIVASSSVVDYASSRFLSTFRGANLGRVVRVENADCNF